MPVEDNDGMITAFRGQYRFLSNFYPAQVSWDDTDYPTVEHAFQAAKSESEEGRTRIAGAKTPADAKRIGQKVPMRPDWDDVKVGVMRDLLRQKFRRNPLRALLLDTDDRPLVEGNDWHDSFWGVCHCGHCPSGQNWLGRLLEEVRAELLSIRP